MSVLDSDVLEVDHNRDGTRSEREDNFDVYGLEGGKMVIDFLISRRTQPRRPRYIRTIRVIAVIFQYNPSGIYPSITETFGLSNSHTMAYGWQAVEGMVTFLFMT